MCATPVDFVRHADGLPFDTAIDMWSLGATLAELYAGREMWHAASKGGLAVEVAQLLGRPPPNLYARGLYARELLPLVAHIPAEAHPHSDVRARLAHELHAPANEPTMLFLDLLAQLLAYDPESRPSAQQALQHPFFAPVFPFGCLAEGPPPADGVVDAADVAAEAADAAFADDRFSEDSKASTQGLEDQTGRDGQADGTRAAARPAAAGATLEGNGAGRTKRQRVRPLEFWRGERVAE